MGGVDPSKPIEVRIFGRKHPAFSGLSDDIVKPDLWMDAKFSENGFIDLYVNGSGYYLEHDNGKVLYCGKHIGEVRNKGVKEEAPRHSGRYFDNGVLEYQGDSEHFNEDMFWLWMRNSAELHCVRTVRISKKLNKELLKRHQEFVERMNQKYDPNEPMGYAYGFKIEVIDPAYIAGEPPLGLTPKTIWQTMRKEQIFEAMKRYAKEGKTIPKAWIEELEELN